LPVTWPKPAQKPHPPVIQLTAFRTLPPVPALSTIRDCPSGRNLASAMTSGWEGFMEFGVSDYIKADFRLDD
jgi:hypothetical protein